MRLLTRDRSFYKSLFSLALPIVLQNFISFAVNFADNLMVGRLGDTAVSAVYMGNQFQTVLQMFVFGIDAAMLIIAAQYWGIRDTKSIRRIAAMGIRWSVLVGAVIAAIVLIFPRFLLGRLTNDAAVVEAAIPYVIFVALSYVFFCASQLLISTMKSVENAKLGFYVSLIALFVNIFLNWVLIFGKFGLPALGVKGAAIATLISRIVEFLIAAVYVFVIDKRLGLKIPDLFLKAPLLRRDFIKNGAPVVAGQMVWAVNMLAYSTIMGHLSPAAITASSIVAQMENLLRVGVFGLSAALGIVTSKTVGAGKFKEMKEYATTAELIFLGIGLLSSLVIVLLKKPFVGFYDISEDAVRTTGQFFNVLTFTFIGTCWQATCLGGLVKSGGDTGFVFKMDSIFVFGVLIPAGVTALLLGAPAWVVFLALKCDQILKCIVAFVKINSFNWMKKLTRENASEQT
ncbi:MAG: MATE family efflux transporter [Lachnospiraceae bacterium]|nr:MATE family efflux transporter [Lachnospiraceae bacterium]